MVVSVSKEVAYHRIHSRSDEVIDELA